MDVYIDILWHSIFCIFAALLTWKYYYPRDQRMLTLALIVSFVSGLLIDVDHYFDYVVAYGWGFNYHQFMGENMFEKSGKLFVFFHGFEYIIILAVLLLVLKKRKHQFIAATLLLSMFGHLVIDILMFSVPLPVFFLAYRIINHFDIHAMFLR